MRKWITGALAIVLVLGVAGCSSEPKIKEKYKEDEGLIESAMEVLDDFLNGPESAEDTAEKLETIADKLSDSLLRVELTTLRLNISSYGRTVRADDIGIDMGDTASDLLEEIKEQAQSFRDSVYE